MLSRWRKQHFLLRRSLYALVKSSIRILWCNLFFIRKLLSLRFSPPLLHMWSPWQHTSPLLHSKIRLCMTSVHPPPPSSLWYTGTGAGLCGCHSRLKLTLLGQCMVDIGTIFLILIKAGEISIEGTETKEKAREGGREGGRWGCYAILEVTGFQWLATFRLWQLFISSPSLPPGHWGTPRSNDCRSLSTSLCYWHHQSLDGSFLKLFSFSH